MPITLAPALARLNERPVHRFAILWRIERTDGEVFRFTDHDTPLIYNYAGSDETYEPAGGVSASAREKQAGVKDHNTETFGPITSTAITEADLRAGRFHEAKIVELLVDWNFPYEGAFQTNIYYIAGLSYGKDIWRAQLSAQPVWFRRDVGKVLSHSCWHKLGEGICGQGVDLAALTVIGTVTTVTSARRDFTDSGLAQAAGYFDYGEVIWTSGLNDGLHHEVFTHLAGGRIQFALFAPFNVQVGDTFTISPGCDQQRTTCKDKFNNLVNFGGGLFIPGTDKLIGGPVP